LVVHRNRHMVYASPPTCTSNVMDWLQSPNCPKEILPHVLSYAGPQTAHSLSQTNRFWKMVMDDDATWRVLCEELYKVRSEAFWMDCGMASLDVRIHLLDGWIPFKNRIFLGTNQALFRPFDSGNKVMPFQFRGATFTSTIPVCQSTTRPFMPP
jgi:hypothetical protein